MRKNKKDKKQDINYLDLIPETNQSIRWHRDLKQRIILEIENKGMFNTIAQKVFGKPRFSKVHLDEMGTFIWPEIDGAKTVQELALLVKEHFGDKAEPLYPRIVKYCVEKQIPITPGCANPSDVEQALENGLDVVKFFPAEQAGGLAYIKAIAAPYVGVKFMPTGGINAKNVKEYLACDKILACGGSWMVKDSFINNHEFEKIRSLTAEAVTLIREEA